MRRPSGALVLPDLQPLSSGGYVVSDCVEYSSKERLNKLLLIAEIVGATSVAVAAAAACSIPALQRLDA